MDITKLDLNLLVVFHHLLIHKRVSVIAPLLGMSQPAVEAFRVSGLAHLLDVSGGNIALLVAMVVVVGL